MAKIIARPGHEVLICEALDVPPFPIADCPAGPSENLADTLLRRARRELFDLDEAASKLLGDENLTAAGRAAALQPLRERAQRAVAARQAELAPVVSDVNEQLNKLYSIPTLARDDAVGANYDERRCNWLAGLPPAERTRRLNELGKPENEPLLLAMLRDPTPSRERDEIAMVRWRERIEARHPSEVAALKTHKAAMEWATEGIARVANAVGRLGLRG